MKRILAFLLGVTEAREPFCKHFTDLTLRDAYDAGRNLAHRVGYRRRHD